MGNNNSQPSNPEQNLNQNQESTKQSQGSKLKKQSTISESQWNLREDLKKKERIKIEKMIEEFKSVYPELQKDSDLNPLTMNLAISQGLHINFSREATKINLQFIPILKKSSLLEVKLLHLVKPEFWANKYDVVSYMHKFKLMTIEATRQGFSITNLPTDCGLSKFELCTKSGESKPIFSR